MACMKVEMLSKCMEAVHNLVQLGQNFSVSVHIGSAFNFDFSNCETGALNCLRKMSPSKKKRNEARRIKFENDKIRSKTKDPPEVPLTVETKNDVSNSEAQSDQSGEDVEVPEYTCKQCGFSSIWLNGLTFHVSSAHEVKRKLKCEEDVFNST